MRTTLKHLLATSFGGDSVSVLHDLFTGKWVELVLDTVNPVPVKATITCKVGGRMLILALLMDEDVAEDFEMNDISVKRVSSGVNSFQATVTNVSETPKRFVAWFIGPKL